MTPLPISSTSESLLGMGGAGPSPFCKTHFVDPSLSQQVLSLSSLFVVELRCGSSCDVPASIL